MPKLHQRLTGFHHLQAVGGIGGNGRTGDGNDVHDAASSRLMSVSPRKTFQSDGNSQISRKDRRADKIIPAWQQAERSE